MKLVVFSVNRTIHLMVLALQENGNRWIEKQESIIVDFHSVDYCNSTNLALVIAWIRHTKWLGKPIRFINLLSMLRVIAKIYSTVEILGMKKSYG